MKIKPLNHAHRIDNFVAKRGGYSRRQSFENPVSIVPRDTERRFPRGEFKPPIQPRYCQTPESTSEGRRDWGKEKETGVIRSRGLGRETGPAPGKGMIKKTPSFRHVLFPRFSTLFSLPFFRQAFPNHLSSTPGGVPPREGAAFPDREEGPPRDAAPSQSPPPREIGFWGDPPLPGPLLPFPQPPSPIFFSMDPPEFMTPEYPPKSG